MLQNCRELRNRPENEEGQTMAEYALLLVLVAVVVIASLTLLGTHISSLFASLTAAFP
jgi:pilus assembly protein Flp/PilA